MAAGTFPSCDARDLVVARSQSGLTDIILIYLALYSRQALKKYILANHKTLAGSQAVFDQQFNKALRTGAEKGDFTQPKGT